MDSQLQMCNNLDMKTGVLLLYNFHCLINLYRLITSLGVLLAILLFSGGVQVRTTNLIIVFLKIDMFCNHNHAEDKINVNMKILFRTPIDGSYIILLYKITYTCLFPCYDKCSDSEPTRIYSSVQSQQTMVGLHFD